MEACGVHFNARHLLTIQRQQKHGHKVFEKNRAEVGRRYKPETIIETPGLVRIDARAFQDFMLNYKLLKNEATHGLAREYKE